MGMDEVGGNIREGEDGISMEGQRGVAHGQDWELLQGQKGSQRRMPFEKVMLKLAEVKCRDKETNLMRVWVLIRQTSAEEM